MECEHGRFHQNVEFCRVDFQPFNEQHGGPQIGRILISTFGHPWCVLVRFDPGDLVRLDDRGPCPCGRTEGLTVSAIEGRIINLTLTPDGIAVTQQHVDAALLAVEDIVEYRLDQLGPADYALRIVAEDGNPAAVANAAADALRGLYGPRATVTVECVPYLAPEPSGKHRLARAHFPVNAEQFLNARFARVT